MSQVLFKTEHDGRRIEVLAGWDPPLEHFFLTVFNLDSEEEDVIYSTMDDYSDADERGTQRLEDKLRVLGIEVPSGFWDTVRLKEDGRTCRRL